MDLEPARNSRIHLQPCTAASDSNPPRIAKIVHHFVDQRTMYLVMERITLQKSPPDFAKIEEAIKWLSEVPLPSNPTLGPVGGGRIRHRFFKEFIAPFNFLDLGILDEYMKRAYSLLSVTGQQKFSPVSVNGERLMFTQSDIQLWSRRKREDGLGGFC